MCVCVCFGVPVSLAFVPRRGEVDGSINLMVGGPATSKGHRSIHIMPNTNMLPGAADCGVSSVRSALAFTFHL